MSVPPGLPSDVGASPPEADDALLESVMREVPRGALAVAAFTVVSRFRRTRPVPEQRGRSRSFAVEKAVGAEMNYPDREGQ
jgi:hypothetical protein